MTMQATMHQSLERHAFNCDGTHREAWLEAIREPISLTEIIRRAAAAHDKAVAWVLDNVGTD